MVTANNYMFRPLTGHHQVVHPMKRGLFYQYHITYPGVHSPLPPANYIPGQNYLLVLPNFTYLLFSSS